MSLLRSLSISTVCVLSLSCGGTDRPAPVEVETPEPSNVTIAPSAPTLSAIGATVQFTATVRDQRGREMQGHSVSWNSSASGVASVDASGLATAHRDGSTTIIAVATPTVSGWADLSVEADPLEITTGSLPNGVVGEPYSLTLEGKGINIPTWSVVAGALPPGLNLEPATGLITGTPTEVGLSTFTLQLASGGQVVTGERSITVISGLLGNGFGDDQYSLIQPGSFQMGSLNGSPDEQPVHLVNITQPFRMQKTEVTQGQWTAIMGYNPSAFGSCGETCPVERVSWDVIQLFLTALNAAYPDANFRLPTEAEWEYAARAGTTGDYAGTGVLEDMGWYKGNAGFKTQFVGLKQPNAWGLYDMHGNVFEWVQDRYSSTYYAESPADDPTGPLLGDSRVLRGGSADQDADESRSANRYSSLPNRPGFTVYFGFRLVRDP